MWVATRDEEVVGFVSFGKCRDEGAPQSQGEVWALYVSPEVWGQGVGRALLDEAVRESQAAGYRVISLWVLSQNQRGLRFYEGCGFSRVVGSEKHFELGGRQVEEVCLKKQNDAPIEVVPHDSTRPLLRADVSH